MLQLVPGIVEPIQQQLDHVGRRESNGHAFFLPSESAHRGDLAQRCLQPVTSSVTVDAGSRT